MSEPTINLQEDLEAWYDFSPRYFDSQRNQIQDRSGYGRHATASGGPTISDNGYRGFGKASFDGSDDYFDVPDISLPSGSAWTVGFLASPGSTEEEYEYITNRYDNYEKGAVWLNSGRVTYDQAPYGIKTSEGIGVDEWGVGVVRRPQDSDTIHVYLLKNGELYHGSGSTSRPNLSVKAIGDALADSKRLHGQLSFVGVWSRALSDAEIQHLSNLTAPREMNL